MAQSWNVYNNQYVIQLFQYKQICAHTNQDKSIDTNTYHNSHNNVASMLGSTCFVFEYMPNT